MIKSILATTLSLGLTLTAAAETNAIGSAIAVPLDTAPTQLNKSYMDTYDPTVGPYGGENIGAAPTVKTGSRMPEFTVPSGIEREQNEYKLDKETATISESMVCDTFDMINFAHLTIEGDVTLVVKERFAIRNQSEIILAEGATLTIYCLNEAGIYDHCLVNPDTTRPADLSFYKMGEKQLIVQNQSALTGSVFAAETSLRVQDGSDFFGALLAKSLYLENQAGAHFTNGGATPTVISPLYD